MDEKIPESLYKGMEAEMSLQTNSFAGPGMLNSGLQPLGEDN